MSNQILIKRSAIANAVPSTGNLALGELAINTNDGKLYTKVDDGGGAVVFELTQNQRITITGDATGNGISSIPLLLNSAQGNITSVGTLSSLTVSGNINGSNAILSGLLSAANVTASANISATGNVSGNYLIAQSAIIGNVEFTDITTANITATGFANITGNVTGGNLITVGNVDATGNIAGNYFIGNGRFLDGIDTTLISNGTTEVRTLQDGNVTFTIGGTANIVVVTPNGIEVTGNVDSDIVTATGNITGGNIITAGELFGSTLRTTSDALINGNLTVAGNLTYINIDDLRVEDPVIILGTGPNGAPLTANDGLDRGVYLEYYSGGATGNAFVGWQNASGNMIIANDVEFSGNDVIQVNSFGTLEAGNAYLESATVTGNLTSGNINTAGTVVASGNISGGNLITVGQVAATGNAIVGGILTDNYYYANGAPLDLQDPAGANTEIQYNLNGDFGATSAFTFDSDTNTLTVSGSGNITTVNSTTITATGNITGGNISSLGVLGVTGNITGGNITTAGIVTAATVNATGALTVGTTAVITGNITGGNISTAGIISGTTIYENGLEVLNVNDTIDGGSY